MSLLWIITAVLCVWTSSIEASSDLHASDRIFGGVDTTINKYPFVVSFGHDWMGHLCGGTIIKNRWILTAAHCIVPYQELPLEDFYVKVGATKLSAGGTIHRLENWIPHEGFNYDIIAHDIGLLKLKTSITYNNQIASVFNPTLKFTALGWGNTEAGMTSDNLKEVSLPFISTNDCKKIWLDYISNKQICTVQTKKGICGGDSGGPLMYKSVQIGITSFGATQCGTMVPDAYTRICRYFTWIFRYAK